MMQGVTQARTALDALGLGGVEEQVRELAVAAQDLVHVWFVGQLRVHLRPVMRCTNKGEIRHEEFERGRRRPPFERPCVRGRCRAASTNMIVSASNRSVSYAVRGSGNGPR